MKNLFRFVVVFHSLVFTLAAFAQSTVNITFDPANAGRAIPSDFLGLSYESHWLHPNETGAYYFNASDQALVNLFQTLGVESIRVGGNSVDRPQHGDPTTADVDQLFKFVQTTQAKVIYAFRLRGGSPEAAAATAKYIEEHYKSEMNAFAIGNEPNVFIKDYPTFRDQWKTFTEAILAVYPDAQFCGPCPTLGKVGWIKDFVSDFAPGKHLAFVTQHYYPGGSAAKVTDPAAARVAMLSDKWPEEYAKLYASFAPALEESGIPYRLEESNSFWNAGAIDASDTFTASLWALDYLYWWASHQAAGINFHTGDQAMISDRLVPCIYSAFWKSPGGYHPRPLAYAMTAFKLTSGGRLMPAQFTGNQEKLNVTAYGIRAPDQSLSLVLINKENGADAREATMQLLVGDSYTSCETMALVAPDNQLAAKTGITLGGAEIEETGNWNGHWSTPIKVTKGILTVKVPASSALLIKVTRS